MKNRDFWKDYHGDRSDATPEMELAVNGRVACSTEIFLRRVVDLASKISIDTKDDVVDIGCGTGLVVWVLKPFCKSVRGVDISERMINYGLKKHALQLETHDIVEPLPEEWNGTMDRALCCALQYLNDEEEVLKVISNVYAILKPGGRALFYDIANLAKKAMYDVSTAFLKEDPHNMANRMMLESKRLWLDLDRVHGMALEVGFKAGMFCGIEVEGLQAMEKVDFLVVK